MGATPRGDQRRLEIEGLRTVAALLVASYHIWFNRVSGGVDVFFVITGFLITLTLAGHIRRNDRIAPVAYLGRLARRIWPGAALVLLAVLAMTVTIAPEPLRPRNFAETLASALYLENWFLSINAVDYLNAQDPHTPVQHFWAMSLQGQFYVIWLLVAVGAWWAARRLRSSFRVVFAILIAAVAVSSFVWSLWHTAAQQPAAYFSTTTRLWEFGVGALIALAGSRIVLRGTPAAIASWVGLVGLVTCGIVLPVGGAFPGTAALWPVACAALLLISSRSNERAWAATRVLALRPFVWLGGMAFGIYLWHWPVLVGYRYLRGEQAQPGWLAGSVMIAAAIVLAILTHYAVERRVTGGWHSQRARASIASVLIASWVAISASAGAGLVQAERLAAEASMESTTIAAAAGHCFGVGATDHAGDCDDIVETLPLVPDRAALLSDTGGAYACYTPSDSDVLRTCTFGSGGTRVALIGNSHAAMFSPGLADRVDELGWTLDVMVGNGCVWAAVRASDSSLSPRCATRLLQTEDRLFGVGYDLVIFAGGRGSASATADEIRSIALNWESLQQTGARVLVLEDNPRIGQAGRDCILAATEASLRSGDCDVTRVDGLAIVDRYAAAAAVNGDVAIVPTVDLYCHDDVCPATIGGVIVYRDEHHVTATYTASTIDTVVERIDAALAGSGR